MNVLYRIDADNIIISVNKGWDYFADSNASPELFGDMVIGKSIWEVIQDPHVESLYSQLFATVREKGEAVNFCFRCDSPHKRRFMDMTVRAIPAAGCLEVECRLEREEELEIPVFFQEKQVEAPRHVKRCSVCNALQVEGEWRDVSEVCHRDDLFDFNRPINVAYVVCDSCIARLQNRINRAGA